jgi:hypothetical protein
MLLTITPRATTSSSVEARYLWYVCEVGSEMSGKWTILWCVKYTEQKYIQNHPLKIMVHKIRGGSNYVSKYGNYRHVRSVVFDCYTSWILYTARCSMGLVKAFRAINRECGTHARLLSSVCCLGPASHGSAIRGPRPQIKNIYML